MFPQRNTGPDWVRKWPKFPAGISSRFLVRVARISGVAKFAT